MPITEQQLKEWEEIEKYATVGEWDLEYWQDALGWLIDHAPTYFSDSNFRPKYKGNDAEFISMARTAVPLLIEEVKRSREVISSIADFLIKKAPNLTPEDYEKFISSRSRKE